MGGADQGDRRERGLIAGFPALFPGSSGGRGGLIRSLVICLWHLSHFLRSVGIHLIGKRSNATKVERGRDSADGVVDHVLYRSQPGFSIHPALRLYHCAMARL
jgi:hypothetical protein